MGMEDKHIDYRSLLKRSLLKIQELETELEEAQSRPKEPIAVVGLGCRFPGGADSPEIFWKILQDGMDTTGDVPADRWDVDLFYDPDMEAPGKMYTKRASFLKSVDAFDPQFFGISPREAISMDPQQRLLLEVCWEALENAGEAPSRFSGSKTGVFVGISGYDYAFLRSTGGDTDADPYFSMGIAHSIASGRISYVLGLEGPSISVDTACSSSLMAVHLACRSLLSGESDATLAGGVNLILSPEGFIKACNSGMLSPDGRCKTFDASADGYGRGEGCGIVVLKRLSDALHEGNEILALIRSTAANQDGRSNGLTAPRGSSQRTVIRDALQYAGIEPSEVGYIEAHGTGTSLGDPIELQSISSVLCRGRSEDRALIVGAVKSNIGHLEAASGIASLIKTVLAVKNREIPPSLNVGTLNPIIPWKELPIKVATEHQSWPAGHERCIAGVSSFGFSGTNVHAIVESPPSKKPREYVDDRPLHLLALSGRSAKALNALVERYLHHFKNNGTEAIGDLCFTANAGRSHFEHRLAIVGKNKDAFYKRLRDFVDQKEDISVLVGNRSTGQLPPLAFLFTGQGAQDVDMGKTLYQSEPVFRKAIAHCNAVLLPLLDVPLLSILYPADDFREKAQRLLSRTAYTQPALFAVEYALAVLWKSWGIEPAAVMGHSVGEYVAACLAGVFSLEDGLRLIAERGRLMQNLPREGGMWAVFTDEKSCLAAIQSCGEPVVVASVNSPENTVLSGPENSLETVINELAARGVGSRRLMVSHAFHSPLMEPMLKAFEKITRSIQFQEPRTDFLSNVTGRMVKNNEVSCAEYWCRHILEPVRFKDSMETLHQQGYRLFLEVGPHPTLLSLARQCLQNMECLLLPSLRRGRNDWEEMLKALGTLYVQGYRIDWQGFEGHRFHRKISLPTYPFERERFWPQFKQQGKISHGSSFHPFLGKPLRSCKSDNIFFEISFDLENTPQLREHRFYGRSIVPAAIYLEMAQAAADYVFNSPIRLVDFNIHASLMMEKGRSVTVQTVVSDLEENGACVEIFSHLDDEGDGPPIWRLHAGGMIKVMSGGEKEGGAADVALLEHLKLRCTKEMDINKYYEILLDLGVYYGPTFRNVVGMRRGEAEVLGQVDAPEAIKNEMTAYHIHPGLLDSCFQILGGARPEGENGPAGKTPLYMPMGLERYTVYKRSAKITWVHGRIRSGFSGDGEMFIGDIVIIDSEGHKVGEVEGLRFKLINNQTLQDAERSEIDKWLYSLQWKTLEDKAEEVESFDTPGRWLILADRGGLGVRISKLLGLKGELSSLVFRDGNGEDTSGKEIAAGDYQALEGLVMEMAAQDSSIRGIIHLWNLDVETEKGMGDDSLHDPACHSLLHLVQALVRVGLKGSTNLTLVTEGCMSCGKNGLRINPHQAPLWGLGRVVVSEHPEFQTKLVDLDPMDSKKVKFRCLWDEVIKGDRKENQISYHDGIRHGLRLTRAMAPRHTGEDDNRGLRKDLPVRKDACYLVTGGTGGLGLSFARLIGERGGHLILLSRHLANQDALKKIQLLEENGVTVTLVQGDVSNREDMEGLFKKIDEKGVLRGIIHAAGLVDDGILINQNKERFGYVMAPKVKGAWWLHKLTERRDLDFFIMCSAGAALFGSSGQGSYAAANTFMDSLASFRQAAGLPALSINWGPWSTIGMAADVNKKVQERWASMGMGMIKPHQGIAALELAHEHSLRRNVSQLAVLPMDWSGYPLQSTENQAVVFLSEIINDVRLQMQSGASAAQESDFSSVLRESDPDHRKGLLMRHIQEQIMGALGLKHSVELALDQGLTALGMDSLMAVEISNRLKRSLGCSLSSTLAFEYPTLRALTDHLVEVLDVNADGEHENGIVSLPPIEPIGRDRELPLSFSQMRQWFLEELEPGTATFIIPFFIRLKGQLNISILEKCFNFLISRHESLRTTFTNTRGNLRQIVSPVHPFKISLDTLEDIPAELREEEAANLVRRETEHGFNLESGPLMRVRLIKLEEQEYILLIVMHHIISDGWSMRVFISELTVLYEAYSKGVPPVLDDIQIQYPDFAYWQQNSMQGPVLEKYLSYWKHQLQDASPILNLPTDYTRPPVRTGRGSSVKIRLSKKLTEEIKELSRENGSLYMFLLAAFNTLLFKYTGQEDICVGTYNANRNRKELENMIGFFVNTLVMRSDLSGNPKFSELLARVQEVAFGAFAHQDLPFELVLESVNPQRRMSHTPLFQAMLVLQNIPYEKFEFADISWQLMEIKKNHADYDVTFWLWEEGDFLTGIIEYSVDLFKEESIIRMSEHFITLLEAIVRDPEQRIAFLPVLSKQEEQHLLDEVIGRRSIAPPPRISKDGLPVHCLFEAKAKEMPEQIALMAGKEKITYRELLERSSGLAHYLQAKGVGPEVCVGIFMERSFEQIIAILGVLKAGGTYLPLEPGLPEERLNFMLQDSGIQIILTGKSELPGLSAHDFVEVCVVDMHSNGGTGESLENAAGEATEENLAYIIYTSGSTGKPKGVMIEHRALSNFVRYASKAYSITPDDRVLQFASINFDASGEEIYPCLVNGATLVLRNNALLASISDFFTWVAANGISVLDLPTAFWQELTISMVEDDLAFPSSVRLVIIGGEKARIATWKLWHERIGATVQLINTYGPTEATIVSTVFDLTPYTGMNPDWKEIPIGRPIENAYGYVLDTFRQLVPIGIPGELYIGGPGLARGYLNRPEIEAECFIADPFSDTPAERLYRTGDIVRYLPDGNLEYEGRTDSQIKIRGYRIEVREIEAVLCEHPDIDDAVVTAFEEQNDQKRLVAYITTRKTGGIAVPEIREYLKNILPDYMVPFLITVVDGFPLNTSGKINLHALPAPAFSRSGLEQAFVAPRNHTENQLVEIWSQLLGVEKIGVRDNFFELGGNSLMIARLTPRISEKLQVNVPLRQFFETPTIAGIAKVIDAIEYLRKVGKNVDMGESMREEIEI